MNGQLHDLQTITAGACTVTLTRDDSFSGAAQAMVVVQGGDTGLEVWLAPAGADLTGTTVAQVSAPQCGIARNTPDRATIDSFMGAGTVTGSTTRFTGTSVETQGGLVAGEGIDFTISWDLQLVSISSNP